MATPNPYPDSPRAGGRRRKTGGPLLWVIVLLALLAFGWYLYNRVGPGTAPAATPGVVTASSIGSEQDAAALRERARFDRRQADDAAAPAAPQRP